LICGRVSLETVPPLSLASQLPQFFAVFAKSVYATVPCGSWLASDGATSINTKGRDEKGDLEGRLF
jgi:hypothetical protein